MENFIFRNFDLFGVSIPISFENDYSYKTNVGATLTIISSIFIIIYTLFQISTLLDRSSYTVITSETQDLTGEIDLSYTPIMFQLLDLSWNPIEYDPKLFVFNATYTEATFQMIDGEMKRIINIKNLEIERCDKLKKEFEALNEFSEYNLTKYMCIKPNQSLILYGSISDSRSNLKTLGIQVLKCDNQTNECSGLDTINNLIEKRIFACTYLGYTTNFTNINNDKNVEYKIYTNFITLSKHLRKALSYSFSICKLNLFDNFFVTYKTETNYFSQQEHLLDFTFIEDISNSSDKLANFNIIYSGYLIEHTKNINGIGPTFSYIMAAFNTIIIICRIINDYFGNKILLSNLFQFLKIKKTNSHNFDKYKNSKENDISYNDLISIAPIINNGIDGKGKLIFNAKKNSRQSNNPSPSVKIRDNQKIDNSKYSKKDYWKFCIFPYCLIKKNQQLYSIKDEPCSIFSVENILITMKSLESLRLLRTEFYEQINKNKITFNNYSKIRKFNECESKSNIEIAKFSELMNDKENIY